VSSILCCSVQLIGTGPSAEAGLPLTILVALAGTPLVMWFWPL
jgi:hypothetical protein